VYTKDTTLISLVLRPWPEGRTEVNNLWSCKLRWKDCCTWLHTDGRCRPRRRCVEDQVLDPESSWRAMVEEWYAKKRPTQV